ncbi:hypothetical protein P4S70_10940 [Enterovibrio sp. Hal110]
MKAWLLYLLAIIAAPVSAELRIEKSSLHTVSETSLLIIKGMNLSDSEVILVIRADDTVNPGYADRANIERVLTKGEFELQVPFASMRTPEVDNSTSMPSKKSLSSLARKNVVLR